MNRCGEICHDGTRCERRQAAETCYLHDEERETPQRHGAPSGNTNGVTHGLTVETEKYIREVLSPAEVRHLFRVFEGLLQQSRNDFDTETETVTIDIDDESSESSSRRSESDDGEEMDRPVANSNVEAARTLLQVAVYQSKLIRTEVTNVENNYLSEDGSNIGYLNAERTTFVSKIRAGMREGGIVV